jgi:prepilin-type N-terminal cleavage/methylation domain-containing protein
MNYFSKNKGLSAQAGFTLTELLVVVAISVVLTTAIIIQQNKWNDNLAVKTQAYELVLMIRQAQIYSLGVREDVGGVGNKFNIGYGMFFSANGNENVSFFADRNNNLKYDSPGEKIEEKIFTRGVKISNVCASACGGAGPKPKKLNISFLRPNPVAHLFYLAANGDDFTPAVSSPALIEVSSADGSYVVTITVADNGQISMQ